MTALHRMAALAACLLVASCGSMQMTPTPDVRQAIAPTGKLRVGLFQGSPAHVVRAPTGELKAGVTHDLGQDLAARLGVPFEPKVYPTVAAFLEAGSKGEWDLGVVAPTPERAKEFDICGRHMDIDYGYLVPEGSRIASNDDVDRPGVRVAVTEKSSPEAHFSKYLRHATLVRAQGLPQIFELLKSGKADVAAAVKDNLRVASAAFPGSHLLEGRPGFDPQAFVIPKGRAPSASEYVRRFVEEAKADGRVKAAIERAGLRGASVATES